MAERTQLQYTPVTGPVWTEPVASRLTWIPQGRAPQRGLAQNRLGDYARPEFAALYKPEGLQWIAEDSYRGQRLPYALTRSGVLDPIPPANPRTLEWIPQGRAPQVPVERRLLGAFAQPVFEALYKPEHLQWDGATRYTARPTTRVQRDWTVGPIQFQAPAYDPRTMEWIPQGREYVARTELRRVADFQQPPFAALFRPEFLTWQSEDSYSGKALPRARLDWTLQQQPIFEPQSLTWLPCGNTRAPVERRLLGAFAQPPFAALYRPDGLQWLLSGLQPARARAPNRLGAWVIDPTQPAAPSTTEFRALFVAYADQQRFTAHADPDRVQATADRQDFDAEDDEDRFEGGADPTRFKTIH